MRDFSPFSLLGRLKFIGPSRERNPFSLLGLLKFIGPSRERNPFKLPRSKGKRNRRGERHNSRRRHAALKAKHRRQRKRVSR